ncbi:MAG TPA: bacillithiol system redox-active protein YtxJ [Luteitalea sp.]|nr:bacillithiol system redox-active protein YtxJ [Luteitalea sp.]
MSSPLHLSRQTDLDHAISETTDEALVLFKHSLTCDRSADAYREVLQLCRELPDLKVAMITPQRDRELCDEMAERFGVVHHTPQVLLIRNGAVTWHARHWGVTADAVKQALDTSSATPSGR